MRKKRNLFNELMEGFDALADQRAGKRNASDACCEIEARTGDQR